MSGPSSRMLTLLSLLQVRREWSGEVLADRLEVSPRTVRRDVDRRRDLGYAIGSVRGRAGGYRLSAGAELPPLLFDDDQAVAIALALAVAPASGADIAEAAVRALGTIRQVMPSRLRHRVDAIDIVAVHGDAAVDPQVLIAVSEATAAHEILRFDYTPAWGPADDRPPLRVEPHAVIASGGRWYLLAWNPAPASGRPDADRSEATAAGDWRTYRVDRIRPRAPTRRSFTPRGIPGGDPAAFVAGRFRGSTGGGAWPCVGTATMSLPAREVAPYVEADAVVEERDDGRTTLTMGSWSWRALAARFAGFDADLEIVGPPPLADAALEVGRRLVAPPFPVQDERPRTS